MPLSANHQHAVGDEEAGHAQHDEGEQQDHDERGLAGVAAEDDSDERRGRDDGGKGKKEAVAVAAAVMMDDEREDAPDGSAPEE